ncbi:DUF2235 domain-containing protein [Dinoroseobacter sp. S375]|uniref:DUF2235 domain-containing protein n=1 Tax=Dinoroseobacter sp. S375 TaxID=3415136 RepID=UPI003C7C20FA
MRTPAPNPAARPAHVPTDHIVILDGTMSSFMPGRETNAGLAYKLIRDRRDPHVTLFYEPGIQWQGWRRSIEVIAGIGINRQIRRAYRFLAHRYRPGDRIFLMGYSRGAYAVRSLAGLIDRFGLIRPEAATAQRVRQLYAYYQERRDSRFAERFADRYCHRKVEIEMVGVWDTVKALGIQMPVLRRLAPMASAFHSDQLSGAVKHGFHALALNERRRAFAPVLWHCPPGWNGHVEQVWFRGTHGDIGGQLAGFSAARPLANIPFVWMLEQAEACGLRLPDGWQDRFPRDANAPSMGSWRSWGKLFVRRRARRVGVDRSESLHESVPRRRRIPPLGALATAAGQSLAAILPRGRAARPAPERISHR